MTEWPEASRLSDALDQRANSFEPASGWDSIQQQLNEPESATPVYEVQISEDDQRRHRSSGALKPVLLAAAILLISVFGARALLEDRSGVSTGIADESPQPTNAPTTGPSSTLAPMSRTFSPIESCSTIELSATPREFLVEANNGEAVPVGGSAGQEWPFQGPAPLSYVVVGAVDPLDIAASTYTMADGEKGQTLYLDATDVVNVDELRSLTLSSLDSTCAPNAPTLVATGPLATRLSLGMACAGLQGRGFHGAIFVNAANPPSDDCIANLPVYLLGDYPATDPTVLAWAQFQGCLVPETASTTDEAMVTRWQQCESTLVHVETPGQNAWDVSEIEGLSVKDFIASIFELVG